MAHQHSARCGEPSLRSAAWHQPSVGSALQAGFNPRRSCPAPCRHQCAGVTVLAHVALVGTGDGTAGGHVARRHRRCSRLVAAGPAGVGIGNHALLALQPAEPLQVPPALAATSRFAVRPVRFGVLEAPAWSCPRSLACCCRRRAARSDKAGEAGQAHGGTWSRDRPPAYPSAMQAASVWLRPRRPRRHCLPPATASPSARSPSSDCACSGRQRLHATRRSMAGSWLASRCCGQR